MPWGILDKPCLLEHIAQSFRCESCLCFLFFTFVEKYLCTPYMSILRVCKQALPQQVWPKTMPQGRRVFLWKKNYYFVICVVTGDYYAYPCISPSLIICLVCLRLSPVGYKPPIETGETNTGRRCGGVCLARSRRQRKVIAICKSRPATPRSHGVSNCTCCAAVGVRSGHSWRFISNKVHDSTGQPLACDGLWPVPSWVFVYMVCALLAFLSGDFVNLGKVYTRGHLSMA